MNSYVPNNNIQKKTQFLSLHLRVSTLLMVQKLKITFEVLVDK